MTTSTLASTSWQPPSANPGRAPALASLGGGLAVAGALGAEVLHGPIHARVVGAAYRPGAPQDGVCKQQLFDHSGRACGLFAPAT